MIKMKSKGECTTFEPQAWRRNVCKNCFRTEPEHKAAEATGGLTQDPKPKDKPKEVKPKEPSSDKKDLKTKDTKEKLGAKPNLKDSKDKDKPERKGLVKQKSTEEEDMDKKPGLRREPGKLQSRFGDRFEKFNKPTDPPPGGKPTWARPQLRSVKERRDSLKKDEETEKETAKKDKPLLGAAAKRDKEPEKDTLKKDKVVKKDEPKTPTKVDTDKDIKDKTEVKDKPKDRFKVIREKDSKDKDTKDKEKEKDKVKEKEKEKDIKKDIKEKEKEKDAKKDIKEKEKEKDKLKDKDKSSKDKDKDKHKEKDKDKDSETKHKKKDKEKKKKSKLDRDSSVEEESSEESSLKKKGPDTASKPKTGRRSAPFEKPKEERESESGKQDKDKNITAASAGGAPSQQIVEETKIAEEPQPAVEVASIATIPQPEVAQEDSSVTEEASVDFTFSLSTAPEASEVSEVTAVSGDSVITNDDVTADFTVNDVAADFTVNDVAADFTVNDVAADFTVNDVAADVTVNDVAAEITVNDDVKVGDVADAASADEIVGETASFTMTIPSTEDTKDVGFRAESSETEGQPELSINLNAPERQSSLVEIGEEPPPEEPRLPQSQPQEATQESPQVQADLIRVRDAETAELEQQQEVERQREVEREQEILARQQQEFLQQQELRHPEQPQEPEKAEEYVQSQTIELSYDNQPQVQEQEQTPEPRYHQSVVLNVNGVHVITDAEDAPVAPPPRVDSEYETQTSNDLLNQVSSSGVDTSPSSDGEGQGVRQFHLLRQRTRHRPRVHSGEWERRTSMEEGDVPSRDEAMMEGTRMLIENLREKIMLLEEKIDRLDREKGALGDLLAVRKAEFNDSELSLHNKIDILEDHCRRIESENTRLLNRSKLPEGERNSIRDQENEICDLKKTIEDMENTIGDLHNDNSNLRQEIGDLHVEMEELHDQFRDEESLEFRELQKELEATAKNCRILQFKLRKVERKNDQLEHERLSYEDKIRQIESRPRSGGGDEASQVRELEEELRMAKEVSVRLHDELEMLEDRRIKTEEELDRAQDYLRESESRRSALQVECDGLLGEVEALRSAKPGDTLDIPKRPMLGKMGSQGSTEFDMEQVMRDLSDSLERENDLKEQLKFAEEENKTLRKKVSEIEDENDALNIQINKITSSGKSGKYAKHRGDRKSAERKSESSDDEDAGELRLQLEIMDNEMKVMRRKMSELETENENLLEEIKYLQGKLSKPARMDPEDDDRPIEERITGLTQHIGELKMKLLQQDYQVEPLSPEVAKKAILKKSRSLDESSLELTKQLDITQRDTQALRDRVMQLKTANENLLAENRRLMGSKSPSGGLVPVITADDAAVRNVELRDTIKNLEKENNDLKDQVRTLDERVVKLSRQVTGTMSDKVTNDDFRETRDKLQAFENEANQLRNKLATVEGENEKLKKDFETQKKPDVVDNKSSDDFNIDMADAVQLKSRLLDIDSELKHLKEVVKTRDTEISRLEEESKVYQEDMDKIMQTFRQREVEWKSDIEALQNKNNVISSLLDLMQERASATTRDTLTSEDPTTPKVSERSCISALSDTDTGSDDVFTRENSRGDNDNARSDVVRRDWDEQFLKRIECLERLLHEERKKNEMNEKKSEVQDGATSSLTDDAKLYQRQIELLQKELSLSQQQLREANDVIMDLKSRFTLVEDARTSTSKQFNDVAKQLEDERKKLLEVEKTLDEERAEWKKKEGDGGPDGDILRRPSGGNLNDKPPSSWRWEKQDLEKQVKELTKKTEDLDKQLKRKMVRSGSITEEDKQKDEKAKEKIDALISDNDKLKEKLTETEKRIQDMLESNNLRESQWSSDREIMDAEKAAAQKELQRQNEVIRMKDEIISGKEDILRKKEQAIIERDDAIKQKDEILVRKEQVLTEQDQTFKLKEDQFNRSEELILGKDHHILELETKLKFMDETIRQRDDRLNEKDFALEKLNRLLSDKESEAKDIDQSVRIAMDRLKGKDSEMVEIKKLADDLSEEKRTLEDKVRDLDEAKRKVERDRDKETAALVIQREKLENQLEYIMREKKCADDEIRLLRHTLNERDDDWAKTKQRYETELGKKQEKIHSLEVLQSSRDSDVIQNIVTEKQNLLKDKQRLEDIVKKLRSELEKSRNAHITEVNNIKRTYTEYKKKLETRTRDCIKLQKEIARLREQLAKRGADHTEVAGVMSPISPFSPTIMSPTIQSPGTMSPTSFSSQSAVRPPDLVGALERQELIFKAERVGIEELYEQKLRLVAEQLNHSKTEMQTLKEENVTQKELLMGGSKTLSELKSKYDIDRNAWNEERNVLERSKLQSEEAVKKMEELESNLDKLRIKLKHEESHRAEMEGNLQIKNKEVELLRKLKQSEGSSVDQASALNETKVMVEKAQQNLKEAEQSREREQLEIFVKLEQLRADWTREKRDIAEKNTKLEERAKQLAPLQRTLIDLQYKLHSYRETWLRERSEMQRQLDEALRSQLEEKQKYVDLLTETKKVKAPKPSPKIERSQSSMDDYRSRSVDFGNPREAASGAAERHKTTHVIALSRQMSSPNAPTPNAGSMDPSHTSKSLPSQNHQEVQLRKEKKTSAPPAFRRSLSSSEAEVQMALTQQISQVKREQQRQVFLSPSGIAGAPSGSSSPVRRSSPQPPEDTNQSKPPIPHSHNSEDDERSRNRTRSGPRRALSTSQEPTNYDTASLERPGRSMHSNRNSIYRSGTQSAYTSRDSSPEKGRQRFGKSPYPAPPPSFLITPPRSPRHFNPSPHCSILTSENMMKLYEKLGNIERVDDHDSDIGMSVTQSAAIAKERTGAVRMLMKSMSVDSYAEDIPARDQTSLPERMSFIDIIRNSKTYEDAPLSQTLPASIRVGELVMTPGIEALSKNFSPAVYRNKVVLSPKTQRRKFFDDYPADAETFALQELEKVAKAQQRELERSGRSKTKHSGAKIRDKSTDSVASVTSIDSVARRERSISEKASAFFSAVKEKRKKFGNKRSGSVEESNLGGHIAKAGLTALRPAAPATPEPPVPAEQPSKSKGRFFHRRAASIDLTTLFRSRESSRDRSSSKLRKSAELLSPATPDSCMTECNALSTGSKKKRSLFGSSNTLPVVHFRLLPNSRTKSETLPRAATESHSTNVGHTSDSTTQNFSETPV